MMMRGFVSVFAGFALLTSAAALQSTAASAADNKGDFSVKGFGLETCQGFLAARSANSGVYVASRSWVNGYLTAYNQISRGTFDIAGKARLDGQMNWLNAYCVKNPQHGFVLAVTAMTAALEPQKLAANPNPGNTPAGGEEVQSTMRDIQKALKIKGFYDGSVDGLFGGGTRKALEAFQRAEGLTITGQPDQATLAKLMR